MELRKLQCQPQRELDAAKAQEQKALFRSLQMAPHIRDHKRKVIEDLRPDHLTVIEFQQRERELD